MQVQECRTIHNAIVTLQKKLLGNSDLVVGRRGNANYTNIADFVRLIHQNLTEKAEIEMEEEKNRLTIELENEQRVTLGIVFKLQ